MLPGQALQHAIVPAQTTPCADGASAEQAAPGMMPGMMPGMLPAMMARMMVPNPMMMMAMMCQMNAMRQAMQQQQQGQDGQEGQEFQGCGASTSVATASPFLATGNPLLAGMMGGNPLLGAGNPLLAGMVGGQHGASEPANEEPKDLIDPEVRELGDYFNIEERWVVRLNQVIKKRQDTKGQDLAKLYEVLERARSPTGLLTVKIGEMECGQFVGKIQPDKLVERIARKFKLDEHVTSRLTELAVRRKATKEEDLDRLEQHLRYCKRPSAMATLLASKLLEGEADELPDLAEAEVLMEKFKLDEDARSKLREIVEKRAADKAEVLAQVEKHLQTSTFPSAMLCRIARPIIEGEKLPDPPERSARQSGGGGDRLNPVAVERRSSGADGGRGRDRERSRDRDKPRYDRDRSRDRERCRRERSRDRDRECREGREGRDAHDYRDSRRDSREGRDGRDGGHRPR